MFWDRSLPYAVEAFVHDGGATDKMRRVHRDFLAYYGLDAAEVPLLEYRCARLGLPGGKPRSEAERTGCFVDVSGS